MADSIRIDTGVKRLLINDGPEVLEFNPSDVAFAERYYNLVKAFRDKLVEFKVRADDISKSTEKDEYGMPANFGEGVAMARELATFVEAEIDKLFGVGTSKKLFGEALSLDMFTQFFEGIAPFFQQARMPKMSRYISEQPGAAKPVHKRHKPKTVMK